MKTLEGLRWKPKWTTHLGSLGGCLEYLGVEMSDAWLFGGTGHAFVMNIHEVLCPSGPTAWNTEMVFKLGRNLGYTIESVFARKGQEHFAETQKRAWEATKQAIDDGLPCYGWELHIPEFYVVHGYDDVGYYFNGPGADGGKMPKPWQELGDTEIGVIEMYSVQSAEAKEDATVVRQALEFAVAIRDDADKWSFDLYKMGLAAYDLWIESTENGKANGFGTAFNAAVWAECRNYARDFLVEAKGRVASVAAEGRVASVAAEGRLNGKCDDLFDKAIESYATVASNLNAVARTFPFINTPNEEIEKNVKDPEHCRTALEHLRAARTAEESGLKTLREIASAL